MKTNIKLIFIFCFLIMLMSLVQAANTCTDSDGLDYNTKGYTTYTLNNVPGKDYDYCLTDTRLIEQICDNNIYAIQPYTCPGGCNDGACLTSECTQDSDCTGGEVCLIKTGQCMSKCDILSIGGTYTNCEEIGGGLCSEDDKFYCFDGSLIRAKSLRSTDDLYFCYVNGEFSQPTFTSCPNGCANGVCKTQVCMPSTEYCSKDNKVMSCSEDGMHEVLVDDCTTKTGKSCKEFAPTEARCDADVKYYCTSNNIDCYWSDVFMIGKCYSTYQDCIDKRSVCCVSADKKSYKMRSGGCLAGENSIRGSDLKSVEATCKNQIITNTCKIEVCESSFGIPDIQCTLHNLWCPIANFLNTFRWLFAGVLSLISLFLGYSYWNRVEKMLKLKHNKYAPYIVAVVLAGLMFWLAYSLFYVALILVVLFIIIRVLIKVYLHV